MRISDWSSDVCSSDLKMLESGDAAGVIVERDGLKQTSDTGAIEAEIAKILRSEEHTSELQSLMRNSYAVIRLNQKQAKRTSLLNILRVSRLSNMNTQLKQNTVIFAFNLRTLLD